MSNFSKAFQVCLSLEMDDGDTPSAMDYVRTLRDAGLLAPDLRIIRTMEELEALGSGAWLMSFTDEIFDDVVMIQSDWIHDYKLDCNDIFPLVVLATGPQIRVARKALEEDND